MKFHNFYFNLFKQPTEKFCWKNMELTMPEKLWKKIYRKLVLRLNWYSLRERGCLNVTLYKSILIRLLGSFLMFLGDMNW